MESRKKSLIDIIDMVGKENGVVLKGKCPDYIINYAEDAEEGESFTDENDMNKRATGLSSIPLSGITTNVPETPVHEDEDEGGVSNKFFGSYYSDSEDSLPSYNNEDKTINNENKTSKNDSSVGRSFKAKSAHEVYKGLGDKMNKEQNHLLKLAKELNSMGFEAKASRVTALGNLKKEANVDDENAYHEAKAKQALKELLQYFGGDWNNSVASYDPQKSKIQDLKKDLADDGVALYKSTADTNYRAATNAAIDTLSSKAYDVVKDILNDFVNGKYHHLVHQDNDPLLVRLGKIRVRAIPWRQTGGSDQDRQGIVIFNNAEYKAPWHGDSPIKDAPNDGWMQGHWHWRAIAHYDSTLIYNINRKVKKAVEHIKPLFEHKKEQLVGSFYEHYPREGPNDVRAGWKFVYEKKEQSPNFGKVTRVYTVHFKWHPNNDTIEELADGATRDRKLAEWRRMGNVKKIADDLRDTYYCEEWSELKELKKTNSSSFDLTKYAAGFSTAQSGYANKAALQAAIQGDSAVSNIQELSGTRETTDTPPKTVKQVVKFNYTPPGSTTAETLYFGLIEGDTSSNPYRRISGLSSSSSRRSSGGGRSGSSGVMVGGSVGAFDANQKTTAGHKAGDHVSDPAEEKKFRAWVRSKYNAAERRKKLDEKGLDQDLGGKAYKNQYTSTAFGIWGDEWLKEVKPDLFKAQSASKDIAVSDEALMQYIMQYMREGTEEGVMPMALAEFDEKKPEGFKGKTRKELLDLYQAYLGPIGQKTAPDNKAKKVEKAKMFIKSPLRKRMLTNSLVQALMAQVPDTESKQIRDDMVSTMVGELATRYKPAESSGQARTSESGRTQLQSRDLYIFDPENIIKETPDIKKGVLAINRENGEPWVFTGPGKIARYSDYFGRTHFSEGHKDAFLKWMGNHKSGMKDTYEKFLDALEDVLVDEAGGWNLGDFNTDAGNLENLRENPIGAKYLQLRERMRSRVRGRDVRSETP